MTVQPLRLMLDGVPTVTTDLTGRVLVATFTRHADARHTLTLLAGGGFPVHRTALVGADLKLVDEDIRPVTPARAGCVGAVAGALVGALLILSGSAVDHVTAGRLVWMVTLGTLSGAALGLGAYAALRHPGTRQRLVAARYELYVDGELAAPAWRLLTHLRPTGMTLVDRVPVDVVALPVDIERFEPGHADAA